MAQCIECRRTIRDTDPNPCPTCTRRAEAAERARRRAIRRDKSTPQLPGMD